MPLYITDSENNLIKIASNSYTHHKGSLVQNKINEESIKEGTFIDNTITDKINSKE